MKTELTTINVPVPGIAVTFSIDEAIKLFTVLCHISGTSSVRTTCDELQRQLYQDIIKSTNGDYRKDYNKYSEMICQYMITC